MFYVSAYFSLKSDTLAIMDADNNLMEYMGVLSHQQPKQ